MPAIRFSAKKEDVVRSRITVTVLTLATAGAMALTGCSSSGNKSGGSGGGSSKSTAGGLGGGGGSSSSAGGGGGGKTYKIGFQGALSGDNQQLGINEINAVNLAVKEANAKPDLGFKVQVLKSDDGGDAAKAPAAAQTLIQDPAVVGVIGPIFSGPTSATGKTYASAGIGLISPSATNADLTKSGFTTFHRIVPTDGVEGLAAADYLAKKAKKVFVVDDTTVYGKGVADVVRGELKAKKVTVQSQGVAQNTQDYGAIAQAVKSSGATAMFYGGYDAQAALFAKALQAAGYTGIRMSGNGGKSSKFETGSGSAGNGFLFSCGCQDATTAPEAKAFNTAYSSAYKTPPSTYSPEAYDATNAMIQAIKDAAAKGPVTRASVETAINALDYKGITTTVKFAPSGEVAQATVNLYEQKNGKIVELGDIKKQK
jgi:branched-chain amino acid transport system substrate-binding protein